MAKKVVHVLGKMDAGGVETWLVNLLKNTDSNQVKHEFLLQKSGKGFYDDEILREGAEIHYCLNHSNLFIYAFRLFRAFKKIKPDVVHSHVHAFSGLVLFVAFLAGVKIRISHCHSDTRNKEKKSSLARRLYIGLMKKLILCFATDNLAVSEKAAECLYGLDWQVQKNISIMPCGIDTSKFDPKFKDLNLRGKLGIPNDAFVIGHVGRFVEAKNHEFLIDVFDSVSKKNPKAYLVLIGEGPLFFEIKEKVQRLGLNDRVLFLGLRKDVPRIMLSVFDIFVFPSLWEGLGLVAVEAQIGGLKVLLSSNIPAEVDIGNAEFIYTYDIPSWCNKISKDMYSIKERPCILDAFDIGKNIFILNKLYFGL